MTVRAKQRAAEAIRREFSKRIVSQGFRRTKTTFWTRERSGFIQFLHLHLFTFESSFRAHLGIRLLNDPFDAPALNGPNSDGSEMRRAFVFSDDGARNLLCVASLEQYFLVHALPWFSRFDTIVALQSPESPLEAELRALAAAPINEHHAKVSRRLLGAI